ncbi:sugar ABC transporter ATP-binding protein [Egicoccus sp. AB-alg6-2]|uniref:sugar ABC transporter ATP-binding protein n=1 Tax=Egicoccus sp. AB-alg6-2 TaxID=3242692 RepID=UPI00359CFF57
MSFLELRDVHKRYGGVLALRGAELAADRGEVHALLGANGSGKSTLNKVLTGVVAPDRATISLDGEPLRIAGPQEAYAHGIVAVYQELSLVPDLTVAANVALGAEATRAGFLRPRAVRQRALGVLDRFRDAFVDGRLPLDRPVRVLSPGEQQIVEIAKALARGPRVLILDEATASLYRAQVDVLFEVVRELRDDGVLVVFTSHRMGEIFEICDRATVLRNGVTAGSVELATTTDAQLVELMVGSAQGAVEQVRDRAGTDGPTTREVGARPVVLAVDELQTAGLHGVSLELHAGEVLGLGGLQGQGQSELLAALFGAVRHRGGHIRLDGDPLRLHRPAQAVRAGIAFVPGNRGREGLFSVRSIAENLTLPTARTRALGRGLLSPRRERAAAAGAVERLRIKIGSLDDPVATLSGGNQQKVVVGKWLVDQPRVVLLDDPTKGIDVGAKQELYEVIATLTTQGVSVLLNSSDDEELLGLSDRVLVLFEGRVVAELPREELTRDRLVTASLHVAPAAMTSDGQERR